MIEKCIPTHLFGELAKTTGGAEIIEGTRAVKGFVDDILNPEAALLQKRACLWAIGHIGSSEIGLGLVMKYKIIPHIISLAESSECLSLRGTSLYALGLISKTLGGKKLLSSFEWQSHSQIGAIVCLPKDPLKFFTIPPIGFKGDFTKNTEDWKNYYERIKSLGLSEEKLKLLKLIGNLSNHITQKTALPEIKKISQKNPDIFMDESLFHSVILMMTNYSFKLLVRRYILSLFEKLLGQPSFLINYSKILK